MTSFNAISQICRSLELCQIIVLQSAK